MESSSFTQEIIVKWYFEHPQNCLYLIEIFKFYKPYDLETLLNKYHLRQGFVNQDQAVLRLILVVVVYDKPLRLFKGKQK
jgi:hypothetical protein